MNMMLWFGPCCGVKTGEAPPQLEQTQLCTVKGLDSQMVTLFPHAETVQLDSFFFLTYFWGFLAFIALGQES